MLLDEVVVRVNTEYTIEEVACIFYLAQKSWVKAGHDEEKSFDELSLMCYERFNEEFFNLKEKPKFIYI